MKKIISLIIAASISMMADSINWQKDFHTGIKEAKKANKPILFINSTHTCKFCIKLDKEIYQDKRVIEELNKNFISIISYNDEKDYLPKELYLIGTPSIWFLKSDKKPIFQSIMGYIPVEQFLKALEIVKAEYRKGN